MREALRSGATGPRGLALAVLACALALRFLVPAGWMPVSDARGFHLTLCSGAGPVDMADMPGMAMHHDMAGMAPMAGMDHHGPAAPHDGQSPHPDHVCPYSGLSLALAEPVLPAVALPAAAEALALPVRPLAVAIGRGLAAPPPPPTGPPALA